MSDPNILQVERAGYLTNVVLRELGTNYDGLRISDRPENPYVTFDMGQLDVGERNDLRIDLEFKRRNPALPRENLCSRLSTFKPDTRSQQEALFYARQLIDLDVSEAAAGLFLHGDVGVGKTHLAVAITKELMERGQNVFYVDASAIKYREVEPLLDSDQAWVFDDLNSPYSSGMGEFKSAVLNAHNNGGRIFVTSNTLYNTLMDKGFVTDSHERNRFLDRIQGMFKVIELTGESLRSATVWHRDVEMTPRQLKADLEIAIADQRFELASEIRDHLKSLEE